MAIGEIHVYLDPFPAFASDLLRFGLQFVGNQAIEQRNVLQPAAIVVLEKVAHENAAGLLIGVKADELSALVRDAHGAFRQHAADLEWPLIPRLLECLPHLLLARTVGRHREGHELL